MQFASPTAFRQAGRQTPLPLPDLVFGNLVERWKPLQPAGRSARRWRRFGAEMPGAHTANRLAQPARAARRTAPSASAGGFGTRLLPRPRGATATGWPRCRCWRNSPATAASACRTATGMGQARRLEDR